MVASEESLAQEGVRRVHTQVFLAQGEVKPHRNTKISQQKWTVSDRRIGRQRKRGSKIE